MKIETIICSETPYFAVAFLILTIALILNRKRTKRPVFLWMTFCAIVLSFIITGAFHQFWIGLLNLVFLLILALVVLFLTEKGFLGLTDEARKDIGRRCKEKHPRLARFHQKHPKLQYALGYGAICGFATYAISLTIMEACRNAWTSLGMGYLEIEEPLASAIILSEGLNSPLKSLLLVVAIWSAVACVVSFVCSLFVRDRNAFRMGAISMLFFYSLLMPAPLTLFQGLLVGSTCATCAYGASKLCFLDVSERLCSRFDSAEGEPVESQDVDAEGN